jgi:hypothetical protein
MVGLCARACRYCGILGKTASKRKKVFSDGELLQGPSALMRNFLNKLRQNV